jgi:hypothetical protein
MLMMITHVLEDRECKIAGEFSTHKVTNVQITKICEEFRQSC